MLVRPFESRDAPLLEPYGRGLGVEPGTPGWIERFQTPSGETTHRLLAVGAGEVGLCEIVASQRPRARHRGAVTLVGAPAAAAAALQAGLELADRWIGLDRLTAYRAVGDPLEALLGVAGFELEGRWPERISQEGALVDAAVWGRLRPGWRPPAPGAAPPFAARGPALPVVVRPVADTDADGLAALMSSRSVAWGTMQLPSVSGDLWRFRLARPWGRVLVAACDGRVVGNSGVHPLPAPSAHVAMMGMSVHPDAQGRGVGRALMSAAIEVCRSWGLRRLDLEVYDDNPRAVALYRSFGFVPCGLERHNVFRLGGFASSSLMSLRLDEACTPT